MTIAPGAEPAYRPDERSSDRSPERPAGPSVEEPTPRPAGRLVAGRFRLLEQLGRGGMGRVFRALDEVLNRPVAVKLIYDDAVCDRDVQHACALEARAAARLNHPGIVRILDSGFDDGHCYVVMTLAEGRTLAEIVREDGPLAVDRAVDLGIQVADALAAAHQEGVIHCDVKPGNLLVDDHFRVRLVDFGIARVTSSTTGLTGELLQGSAQYVAPEQVEGASVDGRTDVYALGTVLYEALAGQTPFGGGTIASILARRLVNDPPSLREHNPGVPPRVEQVVMRALARDPADRFQTAGELREALTALRGTLPVLVSQSRQHPSALAPSSRSAPAAPAGRLAFPRLDLADVWPGARARIGAGTAAFPRAANWGAAVSWLAVRSLARRAGGLGALAGLAPASPPSGPSRRHHLTTARRPTLRAGVGVAMLVGLLMGVAAAKCGVAGAAAEPALAEAAMPVAPTAVATAAQAPTATTMLAPIAAAAAVDDREAAAAAVQSPQPMPAAHHAVTVAGPPAAPPSGAEAPPIEEWAAPPAPERDARSDDERAEQERPKLESPPPPTVPPAPPGEASTPRPAIPAEPLERSEPKPEPPKQPESPKRDERKPDSPGREEPPGQEQEKPKPPKQEEPKPRPPKPPQQAAPPEAKKPDAAPRPAREHPKQNDGRKKERDGDE